MIEKQHSIGWVTFLLSWVAGYCDTATFVAGDSIFSAHVTGNFVLFAAQVSSGMGNAELWIKLITFPVFVFAVMMGGWLAEKARHQYKILLTEGILLMICGLTAILFTLTGGPIEKVYLYLIVMITVFALGLQNAFGKLFARETYGPTTMMTGNVTQASLDFASLLRRGWRNDEVSLKSFQKQFITIGGFLVGCVAGAILAKWMGLSSIIVPGVAIIVCYLQGETSAKPDK